MKPLILTLALLAGGLTLGAQSANVIPLSADDSAAAMKAWLNLKDAEAKWDNIHTEIDTRYLIRADCLQGVSACTSVRKSGFQNGFEFSKDFKFIVPKAPEPAKTIYSPYLLNQCSPSGVCY